MGEADRYTADMWKSHVGRLAGLASSTDAQRRGFRDGFNGEAKPHHHSVKGWFDRGRHTAILLGYIKEPRP